MERFPEPEKPESLSGHDPLLEGPQLRFLNKAFEVIREPERDPLGGEVRWQELWKRVKPYASGMELSDNIRAVVSAFIAKKLPTLKERIPTLGDLNDRALLEALVHNWFQAIGEHIGKTRKEVLLATVAHMVKRVENTVYRKVLERASEKDLQTLGLDGNTRDLLIEVLETAIKADPLYIRFMAYAQLTPQPPEQAAPTSFFLPGHEQPYTPRTLFPHESKFLAQRFSDIAERSQRWIRKTGGEIFKRYLESLAAFYNETDPKRATAAHQNVERLYGELLQSDFPIFLTPATEGYYREPYFDPELKVSVRTPDAIREEQSWKNVQGAMADELGVLGASEFALRMRSQPVKSALVFGGFGVNITFNAVAQEKPAILVFLNEQVRAYDRDFPARAARAVANVPELFGREPSPDERDTLEYISRTDTVLHELAHSIYPDDSPEAQRLGRKPLTILDEVKAEICYRSLVPGIIERGALRGTRQEWAAGMLASSLNVLSEQPAGDPYYHAAAYALNALFESGAVVEEAGMARIIDFDRYYQIQRAAAEKLLTIYRNPAMTERKAAQWIQKNCVPSEQVANLRTHLAAAQVSEKKQ